jgi:hypothetical protein
MKNFSKELNAYLAGPPRLSQAAFADLTGINKSKLSRVLNGVTPMDRPTLDVLVNGVSDADWRRRLVAAYIYDTASPAALSYLKTGSPVAEPWDNLNLEWPKLSRRGQHAVQGLLKHDNLPAVEKALINMAILAGVPLS